MNRVSHKFTFLPSRDKKLMQMSLWILNAVWDILKSSKDFLTQKIFLCVCASIFIVWYKFTAPWSTGVKPREEQRETNKSLNIQCGVDWLKD